MSHSQDHNAQASASLPQASPCLFCSKQVAHHLAPPPGPLWEQGCGCFACVPLLWVETGGSAWILSQSFVVLVGGGGGFVAGT